MKKIITVVVLVALIIIDLYVGISSYISVNSTNGLCNPDNWTTGLMEVTCMSKNYVWNIIHGLITLAVLIRVLIKPITVKFSIVTLLILILLLYPVLAMLLIALLWKYVIVVVIILIVFKAISKNK